MKQGAYDRKAGLLAALKNESQLSVQYLRTEMQGAQIEALKRYFGDAYGDEVEGRSRVTTREVFETIEWVRPDLRRVFTSGDRVCEYEATRPEGEAYAQQASDYVNFLFLQDNPGEAVLDEFIFDGLLQRVGVIAAEWEEAEYAPAQEVTGLNLVEAMQLQEMAQAQQVQVESRSVRQGAPDGHHPDGAFYDFKIKRLSKDAKPSIFTIAPEDFRIAARAVSVDTAPYAGDIVRLLLGDALAKWPKHKEALMGSGHEDEFGANEARTERFRDLEAGPSSVDHQSSESMAREVEILREYIRYDLDGDGYPEMVRCYRFGDTLLEHEEVDEHIYTDWTPIRVPHRWAGLSIADIAADLQRTKTVLLRSALDCTYQSAAPRVAYDKSADVDLDALLTVRPGVAIGVAGNPADKLFPIVAPDLSQGALGMMQWVDRMAESRTGVTRQAQGFDPDVLHDTAKGVELLQNAASVRKEEMARNLAEALQRFFAKLYRLVHKHQNSARAAKIAGQWQSVDPRAWEADLRCTVSTGLGTGAREKQLMMLQMIQADQMAAFANFGPQNPSVTLNELFNTVTEKLRVMGYKSPDKYFKPPVNPDGSPWTPQPQPNPEQAKMEAQKQIEELKARSAREQTVIQAEKDMQVATAQQRDEMVRAEIQAQADQRDAANENAKLTLEAKRTELEHEREMTRMQNEATKSQAELALKAEELAIKREELEVRRSEIAAKRLEAQADREHQAAEGAEDRKAAKTNGAAKQ